MTNQRFVFITKILKDFTKKKKKKRKLRQKFSSGVPRVGVEELLASRFDDGRRTLERPLRLGGAFDRCGMCTALLLRSAHHLCKYDGMPRLKTRFVESNGVLGLPVVFFFTSVVGVLCSRLAGRDGDPRLGGLSRGKDGGRPEISLVRLMPSRCCHPDLL